jgi:hypothetical protein
MDPVVNSFEDVSSTKAHHGTQNVSASKVSAEHGR